MADRGGDTGASPIVEGNYSAVAQWELYLSLTLLAGNFSGNGTVHFVGEPVFTSDCFELEHSFYVFVELRLIVCYVFVSFFDCSVCHDVRGAFPNMSSIAKSMGLTPSVCSNTKRWSPVVSPTT